MAGSDEIYFVCIGCGALNPFGADVCVDCQYRFAGPEGAPVADPVAAPRPRPRPRPVPFEPFAPPTAPIAPPRTFQIGTLLVFIAVIAICLGALRASVGLGIFVIVSLIPATIRVAVVAGHRRARGWPMSLDEKILAFIMALGATYLVAISCITMFVVTCFPTGMLTGRIELALVVGVAGAIATGAWVTSAFFRSGRNRAAREDEIRYY